MLTQATLFVLAALTIFATAAPAQPIDTARALSALRDARDACESDRGALWRRSLCREQDALGLRQSDALNNQLDMRPGRTWLRLEYRALDALPDSRAAKYHAQSALLFRAQRRSIYPGSDSLEATLEIRFCPGPSDARIPGAAAGRPDNQTPPVQ